MRDEAAAQVTSPPLNEMEVTVMLAIGTSGAASPQTRGSAHGSRAGFGVWPKQSFASRCDFRSRHEKSASAGRTRQHARRVRYARFWRRAVLSTVIFGLAAIAPAQEAVTPTETEQLVISATRIPTPAEETPAS